MKLILILTLFSIAIFAQQSRESNESIWDNIASGNYILDTVNDKGGLYIPIKKPNNETIYVPRDYGLMLNTINKPLFQFPKEACSSDQYKVDPPFVLKIDDYCDNLKDRPQNLDEKYLYLCLKSIREKLQTKPQDYTETIKRLLDLPVHEQEFAAAVFTGYGEGRSEVSKN